MTKPSTALVTHNNGVRKVYPRARTRIWRSAFLKALAKTPNVSLAAKAAGVSARTAYNHRDDDPVFGEQWLDALNRSVDKVEAKVFQQAIDGDTQLQMFILKSHRRQIYGDVSRMEIDGRHVGVILLPEKEQKDP